MVFGVRRLSFVVCWSCAVGRVLCVVCCLVFCGVSLLFVCFELLIVVRWLWFVVCCWPHVGCRVLFRVRCVLFVVDCRLSFVACCVLFGVCCAFVVAKSVSFAVWCFFVCCSMCVVCFVYLCCVMVMCCMSCVLIVDCCL